MGFVHQINTQDYMILDSDGLILGVGSKVAEMLQVSPQFFINFSINVQIFAPGMREIFKDYFLELQEEGKKKKSEVTFKEEKFWIFIN